MTTVNKLDERILVVSRDALFDDERDSFQGLTTNPRAIRALNRRMNNYIEVRRGDAEENEFWKQPIPYAIIKRGESVFMYKRLKAGGEARLHDQLSIGVGGHMNRFNDIRDWDINLMLNLHRELNEELDIQSCHIPEPKIIGIINDDSNDVGRVHIGILCLIDLPESADVEVNEVDQLEGYWTRIKDLDKTPLFENLEAWSQIAVRALKD